MTSLPTRDDWPTSPADQAFELALQTGRLSLTDGSPNFVGDYMYMGHKGSRAQFKHVMTREYLA